MARALIGQAATDAYARAKQRARSNARPGFQDDPMTGGPLTFDPNSSGPPQTGGPVTAGQPYGNVGGLPDLFSQHFNYQNGPEGDMFKGVYDNALNGSTQNFNRAANRLRERIDAATAGNVEQATNNNLSRGFGNSGLNNADIFNQQQAGLNAYGQGLVGLEKDFEDSRLKGLDIAGNTASNVANNTQTQNRFDQNNRNVMDELLTRLIGSREDNSARANLQASNNQFLQGENKLDRGLRNRQFDYNKMIDTRSYNDLMEERKRRMKKPRLVTLAPSGGAQFGSSGRR